MLELDLRNNASEDKMRVRWTCAGCGEDCSSETSSARVDLETRRQMCGCCGPKPTFVFQGQCSECLESTTYQTPLFQVERVDPDVCEHKHLKRGRQECRAEGVGREFICRTCLHREFVLRDEN